MTKKHIKLLITALLIVVICMFAALILLRINAGNNIDFNDEEFEKKQEEYIKNDTLKLLEDRNKYISIRNIVYDLFMYIDLLDYNQEVLDDGNFSDIGPDYGMTVLKNILSDDYLKEFATSEEELYNRLSKYINEDVNIKNIYTLDRANNVDVYVVNCRTKHSKEDIVIIVKIDYSSSAFCIYPIEYTKEDAMKIIEGKVQNNDYNKYNYINITDDEMVKIIFEDYKNNFCYYSEEAYNKLNTEYAEKRFGSKNEFYKYVENNKERVKNASLQKYKSEIVEQSTQYICIDEQNNYYIFIEILPMQYTVILDTYTLDLPEFLEKYNSTNAQGKVALNIQKFMQSIDSKDYNYAYNCLSEGFRQNYFKTIDEFKKYAEENFYNKNLVTYEEFEEEGGLYKYTVNIDNASYVEEIKTKTFIVKLNEGTDFEMSFNIN